MHEQNHQDPPQQSFSSLTQLKAKRSASTDSLDILYLRLIVLLAFVFPLLPFLLPLTTLVPNYQSWQSFLLFFATTYTGLSGSYTLLSKVFAFFSGVLGTSLVLLVHRQVLLGSSFLLRRPVAVVVDEYVGLLVTVGYLALFWFLAYRFLLKHRATSGVGEDTLETGSRRVRTRL